MNNKKIILIGTIVIVVLVIFIIIWNNDSIFEFKEDDVLYEKIEITAKTIAENPKKYFSKEVTNYTCENNDAVTGWEIFYADDTNIYLIATNYLYYKDIPNYTEEDNKNNQTEYVISFSENVCKNYKGAEDITNTDIKKWLSYLDYNSSSTEMNMRAVSFLLDTELWSGYAGENANYAIGSPTLDLFCASFNKMYENGIVYEIDEYGYKVKRENDEKYSITVENLTEIDELYFYYKIAGSAALWLAAPSSYKGDALMVVDKMNSKVGFMKYNSGSQGLRPVVCLSSDTVLERQEDGTLIIKK